MRLRARVDETCATTVTFNYGEVSCGCANRSMALEQSFEVARSTYWAGFFDQRVELHCLLQIAQVNESLANQRIFDINAARRQLALRADELLNIFA